MSWIRCLKTVSLLSCVFDLCSCSPNTWQMGAEKAMKTTGQSFTILSCQSLTRLVTLKIIRAQKSNRQTLARWTIITFICTVRIRFCLTSTTTWEISRLNYREGSSSTDNGNVVWRRSRLCQALKSWPIELCVFEPCGRLIRERNVTTNLTHQSMSKQKKRLTWFWIQFSTLKLDAKNWVIYRYS